MTEIKGIVIADDEVEGVHILNNSSNKYSITDERGNFAIMVKLHDTLIVSSIKYFAERIVVDRNVLISKSITIELEELVNELDEVVIGRILTGDLTSDLDLTTVKRDINFYDVGIPGNTNLPITQNERRLEEADHGKFVYYYGLGFAINVNKILNRISGRTRKLKELIALDNRDECMHAARQAYGKVLFPEHEYKKEEILAFYFFASEDPRFKEICLIKNDMIMFAFLQEKQKTFLENLKPIDD